MLELLIVIILFFANFTSGVAGFGMAMVSLPLLTAGGLPLEAAAALVALCGLSTKPVFIRRYWQSLSLSQIWRLTLASAIGIPLGVYLLNTLDERLITSLLGVLITGYVLANLLPLSRWWGLAQSGEWMHHPRMAYVMGFASGVLGGAYNIYGPPAVIYAESQNWSPDRFKGNIQAFAVISTGMITAAHLLEGHYTGEVMRLYLLVLPAVISGVFAGFRMDGHINKARFRQIVLLLLLANGLNLIF